MTPERWATFNACDVCEAPKGEPCRDRRWPGKHYKRPDRYYRCTTHPHPGRTRFTRRERPRTPRPERS